MAGRWSSHALLFILERMLLAVLIAHSVCPVLNLAPRLLLQDPSKPPKMTDQEIIEFIFYPVVNEGCR